MTHHRPRRFPRRRWLRHYARHYRPRVRRRPAPRPRTLVPAGDEYLGSEGAYAYARIGAEVYQYAHGRRRIYCRWVNWPTSHAARRLADRREYARGVEAWQSVRPFEFNGSSIGGERL